MFVSTRAEYSRNVEGTPFPRKAAREEAETLRTRILGALGGDYRCLPMEDADGIVVEALVERGLLSREEADWPAAGAGRAIALEKGGPGACFVNGVDHLRISVRGSGLAVSEAFNRLKERDIELEGRLPFAATLQYGYLTARPADCGSALLLGAVAFLPGILAAGVFDRVVRDLLASGIEPRILAEDKLDPEEPSAAADAPRSPIVHLSARSPMGVDEEAFAANFLSAMRSLAEGERKTRDRVLARDRLKIEDSSYRAAAVLRSARLLSFAEGFRLLAALRAGIAYGTVPRSPSLPDPYAAVDSLLTLTTPGHVRLLGEEKKHPEGDQTRAELVRGTLPHYLID